MTIDHTTPRPQPGAAAASRRRTVRRRPAAGLRRGLVAGACAVLAATVALPPAAAGAAAAGATSAAGTSTPAAAVTDPAALQALLDELVDGGATGAMALVHDGDRTTQLVSGAARLSPRVALRPDARFRIGSLTKTFVATAALQAVAQGRLGLDDPVSRWLGDLVPNGSRITLRMLLNHTSGLASYTSSPVFQEWAATTPTRPATPERLIGLATAAPVTFPPGEGWSYSNTGYLVAGLMLEAATGRTIEDLVQVGILNPLRLTDTRFPEWYPEVSGLHARGYLPPSLTGEGYVDVTRISPTLLWAAGAMVSTARDVQRFHAALLGGRLLPAAMLEEMLTTVPVAAGVGYGLGIESVDRACGTVWGHGGSVPGYFTLVASERGGARTALVMVPTRPDLTLLGLQEAALETAVCQMLGRPAPSPDRAVRTHVPTAAAATWR